MLIELALIVVTAYVGIRWYFKWSYTYWEKRGVLTPKPTFPFGCMDNAFFRTTTIGIRMKNIYDELKAKGLKHGGLYSFAVPIFMPLDPGLIKNIMQKDFNHFVDRGFYHNERDDPLTVNLFAIGGQKWRNLRTKLTPTFTSGKMKMMFDTLVQCSFPMKGAIDKHYTDKEAVDIKDMVARFTTDIIGSCAFGLECNSFKDPNSEFRRYGKRIFDPRTKIESFQIALSLAKPELARALRIRFFPKDATDFFMKAVKDTVRFREDNNITRKDMLQLLINIKNGTTEDKHDGSTLTIEELAAQAFIFFIAGFETSSATMTFCLFELSKHLDIQQKVRDEIERVLQKHGGQITYEAMTEMKYMTQVIDETLRKYPPLPFVTRKCVQDYRVPDTETVIEKGVEVIIPILGLHHDPEHFPNPDKFDPERFSDENKHQIHPFAYLPFGEGPRICIGLRFGMMQTKVGLTTLLKNYKFSVNKKTVDPFIMDRFSFILTSETGIYLDAEKCNLKIRM